MQKIKREYIKKGIILCFILALLVPNTAIAKKVGYVWAPTTHLSVDSTDYNSKWYVDFYTSTDIGFHLKNVHSMITVKKGNIFFYNRKTLDRLMEGFHVFTSKECDNYIPGIGSFWSYMNTLYAEKKSKCTAAYYVMSSKEKPYENTHYPLEEDEKFRILGYVRFSFALFALVERIYD